MQDRVLMRAHIGLNRFQTQALTDLHEAGFEAFPRGNWVCVEGGYRPEAIYTAQGVDEYIAKNEPPAYEVTA